MFIIKNTVTGRIHKEPSRARTGWRGGEYASERAAKAGITRTLKYYQKAIQQVSDVVAEGKSEYYAPLYNAYRDATDPALGRTHVNDPATYEVMSLEQYGDPQVTITYNNKWDGSGPYTSTISLNDVGTHMDPRTETYWTQ